MSLPGTTHRRRVYLARHGEVDYFDSDGATVDDVDSVRLTGRGREQARSLASLLAGTPLDRAVCSGLPRTRETAEIALAGRNRPTLEDEACFREIGVGRIDSVPARRIDTEFTYALETAASDPAAALASGEPIASFYRRVTGGFERLLGQPWTRLLLVAHGGTNRALLSWMIRGGLASLASFEQDECCLNIIDLDVIEGEAVRRYVRVTNLTPYDLVKADHSLTTFERIIEERRRRIGSAAAD